MAQAQGPRAGGAPREVLRPAGSELGAAGLQAALWLLLGGWLGSWGAFAMLVAPAAFRVLPTGLAGDLVAPLLAALHLGGAASGLALALLAWVLARGRLAIALPLALSALCLISHFGVTPQIAELREAVRGAGSEAAAARFQRLHGLSMLLFSAVSLGALVLAGLHARADVRSRRV